MRRQYDMPYTYREGCLCTLAIHIQCVFSVNTPPHSIQSYCVSYRDNLQVRYILYCTQVEWPTPEESSAKIALITR